MEGGDGGEEETKEGSSSSSNSRPPPPLLPPQPPSSTTTSPTISPSTSFVSLELQSGGQVIRRSLSASMRPPLPTIPASGPVGEEDMVTPRPSAPPTPTPRDGENSFHRSLSNTLPRPADMGQDAIRRQQSGG
jgi:hypothetical protein